MSIKKINNVFLSEEIKSLQGSIDKIIFKNDNALGRQIGQIEIPYSLQKKLQNIANYFVFGFSNTFSSPESAILTYSGTVYAEYNNKFGKPNLPPHLDHDTNDVIINYQLSGNIKWEIGLNKKLYCLEDNSALIFNGNKEIHWRPHKIFKDDEFLKMLFFRFGNKNNPSDYSHLDVMLDDEMFKEYNAFRDSLKYNGT